MGNSIKTKIVDLAKVAEQSEKALKSISRASTSASKLSNSALEGGIGGVLCASLMFIGLAMTSLVYAPFLVPAAAVFGVLTGIRLGRDRFDAANDDIEELTDRAWEMRARELQGLNNQIKIARRTNASALSALEHRVTELMLASPEELVDYYSLSRPGGRARLDKDRPFTSRQLRLPAPD